MTLATLTPVAQQFLHSIILIVIVALFTLAGAVVSVLRARRAVHTASVAVRARR